MVRVHHRPLSKARLLGGLLLLLAFAAAPPPAQAQLGLERIGTFSSPTYVTSPPGDASRLFVVERRGVIRVVKRGRKVRRPFADLSDEVLIRDQAETRDQRGMLSMAFAPDDERSGRFYVFFIDQEDRIRVDELRRAGTRRTLLAIPDAGPYHHGGQLAFGPDGKLYVGVGDTNDRAAPQDPLSLKGKILRLDVDEPAPQPEVVVLGVRNPYRFSFDPPANSLFVADIGDDTEEEMTRLPTDGMQGANLGWNVFEGETRRTEGTLQNDVPPTVAHRHDAGWCSIVGGYLVRDRTLPRAVRGRYLYGDVCSGEVHAVRPDGSGHRKLDTVAPYLVSFGQDAQRRLYAVSLLGRVWRLVPSR